MLKPSLLVVFIVIYWQHASLGSFCSGCAWILQTGAWHLALLKWSLPCIVWKNPEQLALIYSLEISHNWKLEAAQTSGNPGCLLRPELWDGLAEDEKKRSLYRILPIMTTITKTLKYLLCCHYCKPSWVVFNLDRNVINQKCTLGCCWKETSKKDKKPNAVIRNSVNQLWRPIWEMERGVNVNK